jgi:hypothetical protein
MGFSPDPGSPLPPNTTAQEDLISHGQRRVNLIWEFTQAAIAILVVATVMGSAAYSVIAQKMDQIPTIMSTAFGMVVGFYFGRTNHANTGGPGWRPPNQTR